MVLEEEEMMVVVVGEEGHVQDVAVVGEPGEELPMVVKTEVSPQRGPDAKIDRDVRRE